VPVSQRSILQDVPGVSAFVAMLIAAGATLVGVVLCAAGGSELTRVFSVCYLCGCVAAALAVRYRGLFTAVVQPPLILFVAVPLAYQFMSEDSGTSPKDIALNAAIPLVDRFPLMLFTTVVTLMIGAYRVYIKRLGPAVASERRSRTTTPSQTASPRTPSRSGAPKSATPRSAATGSAGRPESAAPRQRPSRPAPSGGSTAVGQPTRAPHQRPQRPASPQAARTTATRSEMPAHPMPQVRYRDREGMTNEA
jgi:hypothetical protein